MLNYCPSDFKSISTSDLLKEELNYLGFNLINDYNTMWEKGYVKGDKFLFVKEHTSENLAISLGSYNKQGMLEVYDTIHTDSFGMIKRFLRSHKLIIPSVNIK